MDKQIFDLIKEEIKAIWENKGAESRAYGSLLDDYIGIKLTGTAEELEMYMYFKKRGGILAAVAHQPFLLVSGICLHSSGRK